MQYAVIVDIETTGLNPDVDEIIEVGFVEFRWDQPNRAMTRTWSSLGGADQPLSDEIIRLTGISPENLSEQAIDWSFVRSVLEKASVVIAHNADFEKKFLMKRPELQGLELHWACSMRHIDWSAHGYKSQSLNYLACDHGFVNPFAHRALFDCATTYRLILPYLDEMMARSQETAYLVSAVGSPFESKDLLKGRGYRWNPTDRVWAKTVFEGDLDTERAFLAEKIYQGEPRHLEQAVS